MFEEGLRSGLNRVLSCMPIQCLPAFMPTYSFRISTRPLEVLTDESGGKIIFRMANGESWVGDWAGVMESGVARSLRPWAEPVKLLMEAYRFDNHPWIDIETGGHMWGCVIRGAALGQAAVFALLNKGLPVLKKPALNLKPQAKKSPHGAGS
ncbi:MAG: hypothetical protein JWM78_1639 [Verrucomicrobiaceae bacterium]|nr:hypothetical protein [Verrucomicrobiaceae bacterium]